MSYDPYADFQLRPSTPSGPTLGKLPKPNRPPRKSKPSSKTSTNEQRRKNASDLSMSSSEPDAVKKQIINQAANYLRGIKQKPNLSDKAKSEII